MERLDLILSELSELRQIVEPLMAGNKRFSTDLTKQVRENDKLHKQIENLQKEIFELRKQRDHYMEESHDKWRTEFQRESSMEKQIETLKYTVSALHAEKNVLLRKLNLQPQEEPKELRD